MLKKALIFVTLLVVLSCGAGFWTLHLRHTHEEDCISNMRQLYGASVSYCLEHRLSPESVLSLESLSPFLKGPVICPNGHSAYAPFSVLNGPVCPNGHELEPGLKRPIRTASCNRKVAGLYRAYGFTNLIDSSDQVIQ